MSPPPTIPPVHSPVSAGGILAAGFEAISGDRSVERLAEALRAEYGVHDVVLTDSGTSALALAIRCSGSRVAIPGWSCYDLASACLAAGAEAVLYDVDPETLAPDEESLDAALRLEPDAVVVAHLYGIPALSRRIIERIPPSSTLIDDAAQGSGGSLAGRPLGSLGAFGVLSFGRGKGVTGGGGGALLVRDEDAASRFRELAAPRPRAGRLPLRALVGSVAQWALGRPGWYALPSALPFLQLGETVFQPPHAAATISPFSAGLARRSVRRARDDAEARRRIAEGFARELAGSPIGQVPRAADETAIGGYLRLPFVTTDEAVRRRLRSAAARRLGVMPGYPRTLEDLPGFAPRITGVMEGAGLLADGLFTLPTHRWVTPRIMRAVTELIGDR